MMEKENKTRYSVMLFTYKIMEILKIKNGKKVKGMGIKKGMTVVDYRCGPGIYTEAMAEETGINGRVYAVDIQPMALDRVKKRMKKRGITNVTSKLVRNGKTSIENSCADMVIALDMFHNVSDINGFLCEVKRIIKKDGIFHLEYGHQDRETAMKKVVNSGIWRLIEQDENRILFKVKNF